MYCPKCGKENDEGDFCRFCGEDLSRKSGSGKGLKIALIIIAIAVMGLSVGVVGKTYFARIAEERAQEKARKYHEYISTVTDWREEIEDQEEKYIWDDDDRDKYDKLMSELNDDIRHEEKKKIIEADVEAVTDYLKKLAEKNKNLIDDKYNEISNTIMITCTESDLNTIEKCKSTIEERFDESNYAGVYEQLTVWEDVVTFANTSFNDYHINVKQYDLSDYPNIKLYVEVCDQNGNFVDGLPPEAFFLNEGRSIQGPFTRAKLTNAAKLNQNEGISIGLVADVSSSMEDSIDDAKRAMITFVNSVQFDKGDKIEIVEFSDSAYVCQYFTNDINLINSSIYQMSTYGRTRLYDTLINEIARIGSENNAKCVIGFTDGGDNESVYGPQDVVNMAIANNIPVFLIGIGSYCDSSTLQYIAESTGGMYRNISGIYDLADIYESIYTEQKEMYMLEYCVADADNLEESFVNEIYIRCDDGEGHSKGGCSEPYIIDHMDFFESMYNKFLVAGIDCQTKGERNLIDSGLIVNTPEAIATKGCVAYQCMKSIENGGTGSNVSSTFEVLVDYAVLRVVKEGDGYVLYGRSNYDVSHERTYAKASEDEKRAIVDMYGPVDPNMNFWIELNVTDYEKLTLVKDTDGRWKFLTRTYEREDGGDAVVYNQIYQIYPL